MLVLQSILEFLTIAALAWVMSENRWCVTWNTVAAGLGLQAVLAVLRLKLEFMRELFIGLNDVLLCSAQRAPRQRIAPPFDGPALNLLRPAAILSTIATGTLAYSGRARDEQSSP